MREELFLTFVDSEAEFDTETNKTTYHYPEIYSL